MKQIAKIEHTPPSPEEITAAAVTAATMAAFNPHGNRKVSLNQVIKTCAALVEFLKAAQNAPARTYQDWQRQIESLNLDRSPASPPPSERRTTELDPRQKNHPGQPQGRTR